MFPPANAPTTTFPYRIEAKIGQGSMGIVYRAIEPALGRRVAIKALSQTVLEAETPENVQDFRHRLLQEARAAGKLSHPSITTVYRVGEVEGIFYIAMEWLEGKTLEEILNSERILPIARVAQLGIQLLEGLDVAHQAGIVHRDVKPANLIVLSDDRLKITDFGVARVQNSELVQTQAGTMLGTPRFSSPEQLRLENIDGRSDLFAVGVILYRALTGEFPFIGENFVEVISAILHKQPIAPRKLNPAIPPALEKVLIRTLSKDREARFGSAAEMVDRLQPFTHKRQTESIQALDSIPFGMVVVDEEGRIVQTNHTFRQQMGMSAKTIRGARLGSLPLRPAMTNVGYTDLSTLTLKQTQQQRWLQCLRQQPPGQTQEARYYVDVTGYIQLVEDLRERAVTDPSTGLFSRRALMLLLENEVARSRRYHNRLSILAITVILQDPHGAEVADDVALARIGLWLKEHLRWADLIGRIGDTDFLIILPETHGDAASRLGARLSRGIAGLDSEGENGRSRVIYARYGMATWQAGDDIVRLLNRLHSPSEATD